MALKALAPGERALFLRPPDKTGWAGIVLPREKGDGSWSEEHDPGLLALRRERIAAGD